LKIPSTPRYVINLLNVKSTWTPEPYQMLNWPNPNYFNSLWLGLVAPLVMLPGRIWSEVIKPARAGHIRFALNMLVFIPKSSLLWAIWGISRQIIAPRIDPVTLRASRFMQPSEALKSFVDGDRRAIFESPEVA